MKISDQKNPARPQIGGYAVAIALSTGLTLTAIRAFPRVFLPTDNRDTTQNQPQSQLQTSKIESNKRVERRHFS